MRFRVVQPAGSSVQIGIALIWIVLTSVRLHRNLHAGMHARAAAQTLLLTFWSVALAIHLFHWCFGTVDFEETAIRVRQGFRPQIIPYASIVSADLSPDSSKGKQKVVELEIARLRHDIYPHEYREFRLPEAESFLVAVRQRLASRA